MLLDARSPEEVPSQISTHTVIVGAGTVGLFLAMLHAHAKIPVVLLETGGRVANTSRVNQTALSIGKDHKGVAFGRAFGLGGTSAMWGGQLAEFDQLDLMVPGREWPITYSELRSWYEHVYEFFGITPRDTIDNYRARFGNEIESDPSIERFFTYWLPQPNFATLFQADIVSSQTLRVILNATVNDIIFEGTQAKLVRAAASGGRNIYVSGINFVFALGTIEMSRFFLSIKRRSSVPWKNNDLIGAYFQDHLGGKIAKVQVLNEPRFRFENGVVSGLKIQPKLRFTPKSRLSVTTILAGYYAIDRHQPDHAAENACPASSKSQSIRTTCS
jgi:hypothetical protein